MAIVVIVLRFASLLVLAGPMLLTASGRCERPKSRAHQRGGNQIPLVANLTAVGLHMSALLVSSGSTAGSTALLLASSGSLLATAGAALVLRSRIELGAAWSLAPTADQGTGFVTTGPYRLVRHPIYLGFVLLALGQALAFASWSALVIVVFGIVPTFAWRIRAEETLLRGTFGEQYALYQQRVKMLIPCVL